MSDVRELLARLNPTTIRMDTGTGGGVDVLTNIDIAGALGMVPAGLGRDLLELLHGPDPSQTDVSRTFKGIVCLVLQERNRRSRCYNDARASWGIAECSAQFNRDRCEDTRRSLAILKARIARARDDLFPERLEERMPQIAAVVVRLLKGESLSNRERAINLGLSDSAYREAWAAVVDWLVLELVQAERRAASRLLYVVSSGER